MGRRLGAENLGSTYDSSSARRVRAIKKHASPIPQWSPFASTSVSAGLDHLDRPVDYLSVCRA